MAFTPQRWIEVQTVFHKVVDLPMEKQAAVLAGLCGADDDLLRAVRELLGGDEIRHDVIDDELDAVAARVIVDSDAPGQYGPYRVQRVIGEGGMGVIYLATRADLGQTAAIKVLRNVWISPLGRDRFAAEQRALARLNHPAIAAIYDADTLADGTPWFAMEYVEGASLTEACRERQYGFSDRLRLFREVCQAVHHAHKHLIVHRDLKPSNIMVTADGRIKLLDFGIAKQLDLADAASTQKTATVARMLTPEYAAPEQMTGGDVGIHTDVYALGVILYELLTGERPLAVSELSPLAAQATLLAREPTKPSMAARAHGNQRRVGRSTWADADVLCLTALHKVPARRYQTVDALIRDVDRLLSGRPLEARPDSLSYRARKFVRRHWQAVAAATVVITLVAGLVGFYTVRLRSATNAAVAEAARASRALLFMERLFEGGESDYAPASDLRVLTLVDRGAREARSLRNQPEMQAQLYETLGTIYQGLGEHDKADELLQASLEVRREAGLISATADSLIALGLLRTDQARLEEAERLARSGLDAATRTRPSGHPTIAKAQLTLGRALREGGDYAQAVQWLDRAVAAYAKSPAMESELSIALNALANTHYYAGRLDESETLNERLLALDRRVHGDGHPGVADDLINLGAIQGMRGRPADAAPKYREALAIFEQWHGPRHPETASTMTGLAQVLVRLKQYDEALDLFRRSLDVYRSTYKRSHPRTAMALSGIGVIALERRDFVQAEATFEESLRIYRDVYGAKHSRIAAALGNLASLALARKDAQTGELLLRETLHMYEVTVPANHPSAAAARMKLGEFLLAQHRHVEAERHLLAARKGLESQRVPPADALRTTLENLVRLYDATERIELATAARRDLLRLTSEPLEND